MTTNKPLTKSLLFLLGLLFALTYIGCKVKGFKAANISQPFPDEARDVAINIVANMVEKGNFTGRECSDVTEREGFRVVKAKQLEISQADAKNGMQYRWLVGVNYIYRCKDDEKWHDMSDNTNGSWIILEQSSDGWSVPQNVICTTCAEILNQ